MSTPFETEYYARPRSKKDEKTLSEEGWRDLTPAEAEEFSKCRNITPTGKVDYETICSLLKSGLASLRFYRKDGVCLYFKEADTYLGLGDTESSPELDAVKSMLNKHKKF
jgi:hypothetical protein